MKMAIKREVSLRVYLLLGLPSPDDKKLPSFANSLSILSNEAAHQNSMDAEVARSEMQNSEKYNGILTTQTHLNGLKKDGIQRHDNPSQAFLENGYKL